MSEVRLVDGMLCRYPIGPQGVSAPAYCEREAGHKGVHGYGLSQRLIRPAIKSLRETPRQIAERLAGPHEHAVTIRPCESALSPCAWSERVTAIEAALVEAHKTCDCGPSGHAYSDCPARLAGYEEGRRKGMEEMRERAALSIREEEELEPEGEGGKG